MREGVVRKGGGNAVNRIITVGREFGSGGREFGRRLSEVLGVAYYDREIMTEIARRIELSEKLVRSVSEQSPMASFPIHVGRSFYSVPNPLMMQGQKIFQEQCRILRELSEKSDCVIIGRCADYILRDRNPYRIFLYADMESKMARCREKEPEHEHLTDKELRRRILEIDKRRAQYYSFYTDRKWGDRANYDLCVNTTHADIKKVAAVMARLFEDNGAYRERRP